MDNIKKIIIAIVTGIDKLNNFISAGIMWLIIPLAFVVLIDVIMRYGFNSPTEWGLEVSIMIFGLYMIYSGPSSIYEQVQVGVDVFSSRWSLRTQAIVNSLTYSLVMVLFACFITISLQYGLESWAMKEISVSAWGQPIYHWKMLIPLAVFLTFLQSFSVFLRNLWMAISGEEL